MSLRIGAVVAILALELAGVPLWGGQDYRLVRAAIHLDSDVSDDRGYPIEKLVDLVDKQGIEVAIVTDHDNMAVEYGVWPLRGVIKRRLDLHSIREFGAKRYIDEIDRAAKAHPNMAVMHASEAIPFYYWDTNQMSFWRLVSGDGPWVQNLRNNLTLRNFHKHLLVIGMQNVRDYEGMPSVGAGQPRAYGWKTALSLWPLLVIWIGVSFVRRRRVYRVRTGDLVFKKIKHPYRSYGVLLVGVGILLLYNNYPFAPPAFDQYHGDLGIAPYQALIDYAEKRGGMVFWAHPEADSAKGSMGMSLRTVPYEQDLLKATGYTGFAIFWEGIRRTGSAGGIWDQILRQYCEGVRQKPVWAIGELDYTNEGARLLRETQTLLWVKSLSRHGVLDALRAGRMYATRDFAADYLRLDDFRVVDVAGGREARSGETLLCSGTPAVHVRLTASNGRPRPLNVAVIRDGKTVFTFPSDGSSAFGFEDQAVPRTGSTYYRLLVRPEFPILASNPIFVRFKK